MVTFGLWRKDGKWNSWILLHHLQNRSFWQHRGIAFWIIISHRSLWTLNCNTEMNYNWLLNFRRRLNLQLYFKRKEKLNSLSIGNWTSSRMNIQFFLWVSNGGEPNSNSTNTFYSKCSQKGFKILQKCNFYFKMLLKCFKINSKMQLDS